MRRHFLLLERLRQRVLRYMDVGGVAWSTKPGHFHKYQECGNETVRAFAVIYTLHIA